jgi:hypothetical protein
VNQEKRELKWTAYRGFSDDWDTSVVAYYSITTDGQTSKAKKGAIYGCPYGDPSFDKIGNPAIGWIANLGGLCGNTFSWKSVLLIPDNDPVEFIAKEKPIWEQQSNGEVWVWSSYQEWGQTGTSESFVVPELRCIAEVEEGHEPYLCRLPSDVTTWPENFYVSSSFLGIFVAGLKQDDPALMLSALENASDKSISWVGAQGFPTSREELRALALDDASTRAVPPWIR